VVEMRCRANVQQVNGSQPSVDSNLPLTVSESSGDGSMFFVLELIRL
jgi:hypothetical protein